MNIHLYDDAMSDHTPVFSTSTGFTGFTVLISFYLQTVTIIELFDEFRTVPGLQCSNN